jgi:catalase
MLQIAEKGDRIDDPSIAWPDTRRTVELGTLSLNKAAADNRATQKDLQFLPADLPPGIEVQDQMVYARSKAYATSFDRRQ